MDIALWILAGLAVIVGLAGVVLPLLPGTPLLFGGLWLAAWLDDYARVGAGTLVLVAVLGGVALAVDFVAAALGVKRVGASRQAMIGAGAGAVLGLFGGLPGLVLGPVVGAVAGEWIARRDHARAATAGVAAGLAFVVASAVKVGLGLAMVGAFALAYVL